MIARLRTFFGESRQEFRHVNWPTRAQALRLTLVVVVVSLAVTAFLGGFDYLFAYLLRVFILKL